MQLSLEIRTKILGNLLPDLLEIEDFDGYHLGFNPRKSRKREYRSCQARAREEDDLPPLRGPEEALEPLKLRANVGRATINLTPGPKLDREMMADATKLQVSMMHEGLRHDLDLMYGNPLFL